MGVFCRTISNDERRCRTLMSQQMMPEYENLPIHYTRRGVSGLESDKKGIHLASATSFGRLTVYDFVSLYCHCKDPLNICQKEVKPVVHLSSRRQIDVVRCNICNQDEIACASMKSSKLYLDDIGHRITEPIGILETTPSSTYGNLVSCGPSDVSFGAEENSRVFASSLSGLVYPWDRRTSNRLILELTSNSGNPLNSIDFNIDNWLVSGVSASGFVQHLGCPMWQIIYCGPKSQKYA